jgi:RNA polymerase sigma-70 factor, ECF subfamily
MDLELTREDVSQALTGAPADAARLIARLTPVIQARVARGLLQRRRGTSAGRSVRQEVEDLTQDVFVALFADGGKVLRTWQPERGLSLANFVGLVAERQTASILRSGKRSPWKEDPTLTAELDGSDAGSGPDDTAASRQVLRRLLQRLTEELSPLGRQLFDLIFLRELTVPEVERQTGMSPEAIYAWRSRLRRLAKKLRADLEARLSETAASARSSPTRGGA